MHAITLWEPWASLMRCQEKLIETRSWPWPHDLPAVVAIHAAKREPKELARLINLPGDEGLAWRAACEPIDLRVVEFQATGIYAAAVHRPLPLGCVVAVGRLVACVGTASASLFECLAQTYLHLRPRERYFGDYSPGRYCWVFDRIEPVEPAIPVRGFQKIWEWDAPAEWEEWGRKRLAELLQPTEG